jgi:hypothetical protein
VQGLLERVPNLEATLAVAAGTGGAARHREDD